jgi:hypothetical protein
MDRYGIRIECNSRIFDGIILTRFVAITENLSRFLFYSNQIYFEDSNGSIYEFITSYGFDNTMRYGGVDMELPFRLWGSKLRRIKNPRKV